MKTAFVTGGASGIGLALVEACLARGMNVALADIEDSARARAADILSGHTGQLLLVPCDVADRAQVQALARRASDELGPVDLVCANAGVTTVEQERCLLTFCA